MALLEPKDLEVNGKIFTLSKFPAIAGREIVAKYPTSGLPKIGDYDVNEATMLKLMSYVAVPRENGGEPIRLASKDFVNSHVTDWETLAKIEMAMLEYNCTFLQNGRVSNFLGDIVQKLPAFVSKIVMDSLRQSSETEKQP